jgi:hypothetical protein
MKTPMTRSHSKRFRSRFEQKIAANLSQNAVAYTYETLKLPYQKPPSIYKPDFILSSGLILEVKGRFTSKDRTKHLLIKQQYPHLDIRFVFQNANQRLSKTSTTTYAEWCLKHGFHYAHRHLPLEWIK